MRFGARLGVALGLSIAIHALGFGLGFGFVQRAGGVVPSAPPPQTVDVDIVLAPPAVPPLVSSGSSTAAVAKPAAHPRAKKRSPIPAVALPFAHAAASEAVAVAPAADSRGHATNDEASSEGTDGDKAGDPAPGTPIGLGSASKPATLDLRPFFERLQTAARRCAGARRGDARVRFCVDPSGAPTNVSLVQSSGNFALDDAAVHCVIPGAAPLPLTDRCLVVPLLFR